MLEYLCLYVNIRYMRMSIAVIYMGGTFGCIGKPLAPMPAQQFITHLNQLELEDINDCHFFVAPAVVDSSCCTAQDWLKLVQFIHQLHQHQGFEKFIVLHGTDTLSYATALLNRFIKAQLCVVLTGSQLPLLDVEGVSIRQDSDALANLKFAIQCVQTHTEGVYLAFAQQCIAKGQALKIQTHDFNAFTTQKRKENLALPYHLDVTDSDIRDVKHCSILNLMLQPIGIKQLNQHLEQLLNDPPHFLILQGYGVGNFAINDEFLSILQQLKSQNCLTILSSQVALGELSQNYAVSDWVNTADICLDNTQSYADLYAKCIQLYLTFNNSEQRFENWVKY